MTEPIIRVHNLHRSFGNVRAVRGVTFEISPGQVVGFIGQNGAGKTTTMRMMATLESPDAGSIEICGYSVIGYPYKVRRLIGWMPDAYGTYENVTVLDYLDFFARAYGYKGDERRRRIDEVMDFADLGPLADRQMKSLSKGMGQRLCLGRTLLHDPEVLILDEPAAGLDPKARMELKNLIRILADRGKTVFISSHILSELGEMCNWLLFIDSGKIVHSGSAESLKYETGDEITMEIRVLGGAGRLTQWVDFHPNIEVKEKVKDGAIVSLKLPPEETPAPAPKPSVAPAAAAGGNGDAPVAADSEAQSPPPPPAAAVPPPPPAESIEEALQRRAQEASADLLQQLVKDGIGVIEFRRTEQRLEDAFVNLIRNLEQGQNEHSPYGR